MKTVRLLFSDEMARAIVQGRKTVTRRPVISRASGPVINDEYVRDQDGYPDGIERAVFQRGDELMGVAFPCAPGDILIGRECWADVDGVAVYRADGARTLADWRSEYGKRCAFHGCKYCEDCFAPYMWESKPSVETWRPSIHMPDWAARIRRRVVSVTVERLQDVTIQDAVREGFPTDRHGGTDARNDFLCAWDDIYLNRGLASEVNPWVWRIEFEFERESVREASNGR